VAARLSAANHAEGQSADWCPGRLADHRFSTGLKIDKCKMQNANCFGRLLFNFHFSIINFHFSI